MRKPIALLFIPVVLGACGRGDDRTSGAGADSAAASGPLVLLLDAPATARAGEEVPIAVTLVNRGAEPVEVGLQSPDVVVARPDGGEVWRRSRHQAPPAPISPITLRPKEMRGSGYGWDQRDDTGRPVAPGTYHVRAEIPARHLTSEQRTVVIQP